MQEWKCERRLTVFAVIRSIPAAASTFAAFELTRGTSRVSWPAFIRTDDSGRVPGEDDWCMIPSCKGDGAILDMIGGYSCCCAAADCAHVAIYLASQMALARGWWIQNAIAVDRGNWALQHAFVTGTAGARPRSQ